MSCKTSSYSIYQYDNGDDYLCEGLRRIVDTSGKIGFADEKGTVVISPQFAFAFPFKNGLAKATFEGGLVAEGEYHRWISPNWFLINHNGDIVKHERRYNQVKERLKTYSAAQDARIGVSVIIDSKDTVSVNGNSDFPMMSVFKFPLALAVAKFVDSNGMMLSDSVAFGSDTLREDTYSPMLKKYGKKLNGMSIKELLEWALIESDNNAADILLNHIGGTSGITAIMKEIGINNGIKIGASENDMHRDTNKSYLNSSTPIAMAALFDRFDVEMRHDSESFSEISVMLEQCRTGIDRLAAPLNPTNAVIGHKTGTGFITSDGRISAINDCGYVHLPNGMRYSIAVFIADSAYDIDATSRMIADISEIVIQGLVKR